MPSPRPGSAWRPVGSPVTGSAKCDIKIGISQRRCAGAAHLWLHLYDVQMEPFHLHFTYPPFAGLLFWPLAQLLVHVGQVAWAVINLVALVALSALSVRAGRPDWALRRIWAIAVIAVFPMLEVEYCGRREPADGASC